jgi:hypothetical protein
MEKSLIGVASWDVDVVEDERWGFALVANRQFEQGEVVIRSMRLLLGDTVAECVRLVNAWPAGAFGRRRLTHVLELAARSPR